MKTKASSQIQKDVKVPAMGESIMEATLSRWLKKKGEVVAEDEPLAEIETDKVTLEIGAPISGVLTEVLVKEGESVEVGAIVGRVTQEDASAPQKEALIEEEKIESAPDKTKPQTKLTSVSSPQFSEEIALSPAVRKLVAESQIDPRQIEGKGKEGRLTKGDVLAFLDKGNMMEKPEPKPSSPSPAPPSSDQRKAETRVERIRMSRLRQRIAERLKEAQNTAAILTTFNEADMTNIMAFRAHLKEPFEKKHGIKLGLMSFFVKACLVALKEIPAVNAEIEGEDIIYKNYYDIGVAVGTPQGLVVPVVREADQKSFAEVEKEIAALSQKARNGKLTMQDLQGGTFTISNGGVYGSLVSTPILNPPQSGILGMHKIQDRPMAVEGHVQIRPMMYLALSYDHRIIDGSEAVTFLVRVKECIENPERILLDV